MGFPNKRVDSLSAHASILNMQNPDAPRPLENRRKPMPDSLVKLDPNFVIPKHYEGKIKHGAAYKVIKIDDANSKRPSYWIGPTDMSEADKEAFRARTLSPLDLVTAVETMEKTGELPPEHKRFANVVGVPWNALTILDN